MTTTLTNGELTDVVCERPLPIEIGGRFFYICPPSLGKTLLLSNLLGELRISRAAIEKNNPIVYLLQCISEHREVVLRVAVMMLSKTREQLLDEDYIRRGVKFLSSHVDDADLATIVQAYLSFKPVEYYQKALKITDEKKRLERINRAKDRSTSVSIGGVSMFGALIDVACERYGWTYDYTVWGISLRTLQLVLSDAPQSIYLTAEEAKRAHISTDGIRLDADDPNNIEQIEKILSK